MGLEAAIRVGDPGVCPVAEASERTDEPIESVSRTSVADSTIGEFEAACETTPVAAEPVFEADGRGVYRFERDPAEPCLCERIERFGCPVVDIHASDGELTVVFRPDDVGTFEAIVSMLRETFADVGLEYLHRPRRSTGVDAAILEHSRLTDRQREVLETAYEMGYFEHPRHANAQDVAAALEIAPATFAEHLAIAQSKLFEAVFES